MRFVMMVAALGLGSLGLASAGAQATEVQCKGNEVNQKAVEEMTEILFNQRDADQAPRFYAPTVTSHNTDGANSAGITQVPIAQMQAMWRGFKVSLPDRKLVNDLILCSGDTVTVRTTVTGSMTGPMNGIPPTGKSFTMSAIDIYRFKDGKVVERWGNADGMGMLMQLGILDQVIAMQKKAPAK